MRTTTDMSVTLRGAVVGTHLVIARAIHLTESGRGRAVLEHQTFEVTARAATRGIKGTTLLTLRALSGGRKDEREEMTLDCKDIPADFKGVAVYLMTEGTVPVKAPVEAKPARVKGKLPADEVTALVSEVQALVESEPVTPLPNVIIPAPRLLTEEMISGLPTVS